MSQSRFARNVATPAADPQKKRADFLALVEKVKAQVIGMQLNREYTRTILDGIDQIAKATE